MVSVTSFMLFILFVIYLAGTCTAQCEAGQYFENGTTCKNCSYRCATCINFTNCTACKKSYYWEKACRYDCVGCHNCSKDHGCISDCDIYYVKSYDKIKGGYICTRCPEGYYLPDRLKCVSCPKTCKDNNCNKISGNCENGCQTGWFGEKCISECNSTCKQTICFQHNGTCVYGHVDDETEIITNTAVAIGVGAGAAVVIALVIVLIVLVIRRRRATRTREHSEDTIDVVEDKNTQDQGHVTYATVNKQPSEAKHVEEDHNTPPKNDVTYATVNKKKPAFETLPNPSDKSSVVMSNLTGNVA